MTKGRSFEAAYAEMAQRNFALWTSFQEAVLASRSLQDLIATCSAYFNKSTQAARENILTFSDVGWARQPHQPGDSTGANE